MTAHLYSHGLKDCDFWLQQLKELGIHSNEEITRLRGDMKTFAKLKAKARNSAEENGVLCLMTIDPNSLKNVLTIAPEKETTGCNEQVLLVSQDRHCKNALDLLERLGLKDYSPCGPKILQLKDALCVRQEPLKLSLSELPTDSKKLYSLVLYKIMTYDSLCRSDLIPVKKIDSDTDESEDESDDNTYDNTGGIHPVDCLLSLIICSDDFLRQDLFSRLAKCQLAVPFILPNPITNELSIPLWGLRSIIKDWEREPNEKGEETKLTHTLVSYKMPIVTFIRIGKHKQDVRSKSAILNEVVNVSSDHYDHFFHRDCAGGEYKLLLGKGLVDMCWYLPGKKSNAFPDAVTFLNLHGDSRHYPEQLGFLSQISSMCFVLLTEESLELDDNTAQIMMQFSQALGGITILGSSKNIHESLKDKTVIRLKRKNMNQIKDSIQREINEKLYKASHTFQSIEDCCSNKRVVILTDEHSEAYVQSKDMAAKVLALIPKPQALPKASHEPNIRDTVLPLQGEKMWKAWAKKDKELMRQTERGDKPVNKYTEEVREQKTAIRKKQLKHVQLLPPLMKTFIASLLKLRGSPNRYKRNYFLQCLKLELNNISKKSVSDLQDQYHRKRKEYAEYQKKKMPEADTEQTKRELKEIEDSIISSSLGLEHLLRELALVYEVAVSKMHLYDNMLDCLPKAAAELLIDGHPLELMDGDAAHVPLQWVTAVLKEATKILQDPNIIVLSVLGLQSTGKSTMLNTVFGVQFGVSAGRCTRGAFMQLLPLDEELRTQTECDYILIVDTEGLRAPQLNHLDTLTHDNELATFVIGLANMTLINIYGEVPGDMNDILQTSVHAFLRMTQVKFSSSCLFVHHNAAASLSGNIGCVKLTERLDKFTIDAAEEEKCKGKYKCFNDIIKFNDQTDVHYFPGLWKGDPPMAPVNQGYSFAAQKLKHNLIEKLPKKSTHSLLEGTITAGPLSAFQVKIHDLWNALLQENFVFSFKNTQEIIAYNKLETEYSKWDWELRVAMLRWEQEAENEINATEVESASRLAEQKCKELLEHISSLSKPIDEQIEIFFSGKYKEIVIKWKEQFKLRWKLLLEELRDNANSHCTRLGKKREVLAMFEHSKKNYTAKITSKVQDYIAKLKREQREQESLNEQTEEELQKIFNDIWTGIIKELPKTFTRPIDIEHEVEKKLIKFVAKYATQFVAKLRQKNSLKEWGTKLELEPSVTHYNEEKTTFQRVGETLVKIFSSKPTDPIKAVEQRTDEVFGKAKKCLDNIIQQKTDFNPGFAQELLREVDAAIAEAEDEQLTFTQEYRCTVHLIVCGYAVPKFEEMARRFKQESDPHLFLEKKEKKPLFSQFKNLYLQTKAEEAIAKTLCVRLEDSMKDRIEQVIGSKMVGEMRASERHFASTMDLRVKILTDLYEENSFEHTMEYVMNVKDCLHKRIKHYTEQYCNESIYGAGETRLQSAAKDEVSKILTLVNTKVSEVCFRVAPEMRRSKEEIKIPRAKFQIWLSTFSKTLIKQLGSINVDALLIGYDSLQEISLTNFIKQIKNELQDLEKRLHTFYATIECKDNMENWNDKPYDLLSDLVGCTEQCPFCGEQCDLRDPNHYKNNNIKHRTGVHRPSCLARFRDEDSEVMVTEFCPFLISSDQIFRDDKTNGEFHPYKKYEEIHPEWSIPPDPSAESCLYWKWFVAKYSEELAETYDAKPADVPQSWCDIEWPEVAKNLTEAYKIETSRN